MVISDVYTERIEAVKGAILPCALDLSSCSILAAAGKFISFNSETTQRFLKLACESEFRHLYHGLGIAIIHQCVELFFSIIDVFARAIEGISYGAGCGNHFKNSAQLRRIAGANGLGY